MQNKTKNIAETIAHSQCVFQATRFNVRSIELSSESGHTSKREFVDQPGAVVILPMIDSEHVVMIRNERFAVGQELLLYYQTFFA
jgi:ADP-ribose pyrophosphatase